MASRPYFILDEMATRPGRDTAVAAVVRWTFITLSMVFLAALLFAPLATVVAMALAKGWGA